MRVLLLSDWMSNRGGAEAYIVALRDALRAEGDDVKLLSCGAGAAGEGDADMRAYGTDATMAQAFLQVSNPFAASRVRAAVREMKPDAAIVSQFAYHLSPAILAALKPVPTIVSMMDYKAICPLGTRLLPRGDLCKVRAGLVCKTNGCVGITHWMREQPRYSRIRAAIALADKVLCPSPWARRELLEAGIDATVLPLGIRLGAESSAAPSGNPTFVFSGRLSREKGVAILIAAFAKVVAGFPDARLRIVGDGPLRRELQALAAALGIADTVEFTGWVDESEVSARSGDAWAHVCPSLWAEPFGMAAVESIVRGVPVIASDAGGFQDTVIDGVNGLRFPIGDVASLAECMRAVAAGKKFPSHRLGQDVIRESAELYGMKRHVLRMREVLSGVVMRGPG